LLPPSGSRFQTRWFLHLLYRRRHETVPEPFSHPARRFLHARDWWRLLRCHRHGTRPVNGHRPRGWTSDLFPFQAEARARGEPCGHLLTSLVDSQTSRMYSSNSRQYMYSACI
jgi:hypothetical protein